MPPAFTGIWHVNTNKHLRNKTCAPDTTGHLQVFTSRPLFTVPSSYPVDVVPINITRAGMSLLRLHEQIMTPALFTKINTTIIDTIICYLLF
jgi:hypothetical protein